MTQLARSGDEHTLWERSPDRDLGSLLPALLLASLLSGCASLPDHSGQAEVAGLLAARGQDGLESHDAQSKQQLLAELAGQPLEIHDAVRIALVNNPQIRAEYASLGFAAAEVYDAGRISNPVLSASVLIPDASGASDQVGFGVVQSFSDLLLLSARSRFAVGEYERVRHLIGARLLDIAADTETAYIELVSRMQLVSMRAASASAATASADLAQRFLDAGNLSALDFALQQAAASEAQLRLQQAEADVVAARSVLNQLFGFAATDDGWSVRGELPELLHEDASLVELLARADASRLDLLAARQQVALLADALGTTRRFRLLGEVQAGVATERETDRSRITGPTLALELPIFNQGRGRVARSEAALQAAEAELGALEVDISNAVMRSVAAVEAARTRAMHYHDSLIPLREAIVARTQESVNYMLDDPFRLLLAKQQEYDAYQGYLEAVRDYWFARIDLGRAVGATLPGNGSSENTSIDVNDPVPPEPRADPTPHTHGETQGDQGSPQTDHSGHDMH